jgi:TP901 family phage tail tape measure protein
MAESAKTELDWVIRGIKDVKAMALALNELLTAQKELNTVLGKDVKHTVQLTKMLADGKKMRVTLDQTADGAKRVKTELWDVGKNTKKAAANAKGLLLSWQSIKRIIIGSLISRGIGKLIRALGDGAREEMAFQRRISEIRTISQNAKLDFKQWALAVQDLSDRFNRAPLDVAEGIYQTLSNQVTEGTNAIAFMSQALRLSQITVSSATESVQALTAAINAYRYTVADARYISDVFFKTVELGRLRLGEIANTIGRVLVLGKQLGLSFEDVTASVAALSIQGIRASEAQTWLRNVMLKLIRPTDRMKELFAEWGVVSGVAAIETFGWVGVLEKLKKAVDESGDGLSELGAMFNRIRATTGAAGLVGNIDTLKDALEEMKNSTESAADAFDKIRESAGFQLQRELQKLSNYFSIELGQQLIEALHDATKWMGGLAIVIKRVTQAAIILGTALLLTMGTSLIITIAKGVHGLWVLSGAITLAQAKTAALDAQVKVLGISISIATFGFTLLATAATAFGYVLYTVIQNSKKSILEYTDFQRYTIFASFADIAARENELNSDRARQAANVAKEMKRVYMTAVADMAAAATKLKLIEQDRLTSQNIAFQMSMLMASPEEKLVLINARLLSLEKEYRHEMGLEKRDWEVIRKIKSDIASTYGMSTGLDVKTWGWVKESKYSNEYIWGLVKGSQEAHNAMFKVLQVTDEVTKEFEKYPKVSRSALASVQERIKKVEEEVDIIGDINATQNTYTEAVNDANDAQKALNAQIISTINLLEQATDNAKLLHGLSQGQFLLELKDRYYDWFVGGDTTTAQTLIENKDAFQEAFKSARALAQQMRYNAAYGAEEFIALSKAIDLLPGRYDKIKEHMPLNEFDEFLFKLKEAVTAGKALAIEKDDLANKTRILQAAIQGGGVETQEFKDAMKLLGDDSVHSLEDIVAALDVVEGKTRNVTSELRGLLQALATDIAAFNAKVGRTKRLSGQGSWTGGMATRFASGGSVGSDSIHALLRPGEYIMNKDSARQFFPELVAMNSRAARFDTGGDVVNNNIGDINLTIQGGDSDEMTVRRIGNSLRREIRRGTIRLN